jgi:hypothetical protein
MLGGSLIVSACLVSASEGTDEALDNIRRQVVRARRRINARARPGVEATLLGLLGFGPALAEAVEKVEEVVGGTAPL